MAGVDPRSPSIGGGPTSSVSSGKKLDYLRGPTRRLEAPRTVTPPEKSSGKTVQPSGKSGAGKAGAVSKPTSADIRKGHDDLGKLRRTDPQRAREILTTSETLGRVHDTAVRTAVGKLGGVYDSPYRGGDSHKDKPWGFDCDDDDIDFFFGFSFGWGFNPCTWWWWPCYVGWYYPYHCSTYYPWYYYQSYYAYPVYTTIYYPYPDYGGQEVVYAEPTQVVEEPVGESVVRYEAAPAPSTLSIAAQRYLDLGDRAFREGRYTDAIQFYAKAVEFAPDEGALYLVLADALFAAGDYHYGAYAIRRALELDPRLVDVEIDKRSFYPDPSVFERQLAALEGYMAQHPDDRDARLVLALNYLFGGRAKDAVRELEVRQTGSDDPAAARILAAARLRAP